MRLDLSLCALLWVQAGSYSDEFKDDIICVFCVGGSGGHVFMSCWVPRTRISDHYDLGGMSGLSIQRKLLTALIKKFKKQKNPIIVSRRSSQG